MEHTGHAGFTGRVLPHGGRAGGGIILKPVNRRPDERNIMLGTILLVLLICMFIGAFPAWPHSRKWGYYPSGGLGLALLILLVLILLGRI
jgi:hypothetical protein